MPVLLVPPVEVVSESPELPALLRQARIDYAGELRSSLGVSGAPTSVERTGGFRGLERYDYAGPGDAILFGAFLVAPGSDKKAEFLRIGALVRAADCTLAGATWSKGAADLPGLPDDLRAGGPSLAGAKARVPRAVNTVRWETEARGPWREAATLALDAVAGETLAARNLPVNGTLTRLACAWNGFRGGLAAKAPGAANPSSPEAPYAKSAALVVAPGPAGARDYPRRAHRVLRATLEVEEPKETRARIESWPRAVASVTLVGGVFGERKEILFAPKGAATPIVPSRLASDVAGKVDPAVHDVRPTGFRIARRDRRWIYLDRGRAYGLEVGVHLVGAGGAKLHVIHFAPGETGADVAVALLRAEDPATPLKVGDVVSFDPTQFPLRSGAGGGAGGAAGSPALETQPL